MARPLEHDIFITKGDSFTDSWQILSGPKGAETAVDFSSSTIKMTIKSTDLQTTHATWTSGDSKITKDSSGNITMACVPSDTSGLSFTTAVYDIEVTTGSAVRTWLKGKVTLIEGVS